MTAAANERFESPDAALLRRNRLVVGGAVAAAATLLSFIIAAASSSGKALATLPTFVMLGIVGAFALYKYTPRVSTKGTIAADREGLWHEGKLVCARGDLKQGFVVADAPRWRVQLQRKGIRADINVSVPDEAEGRRLLHALGLDATQAAAELRARSPIAARPWILAVLGLMLGFVLPLSTRVIHGPARGVLPLVFVGSLLTYLAALAVPMKVRVGADGILTRWMGRQRFYPYGSITAIRRYENAIMMRTYIGLELVLASGEKVRLPMGQRRWDEGDVSLMYSRVSQAVDAYRAGYSGAETSALTRGAHAWKDWIVSLRAIGTGASADMRRAPIPADRLMRVALDTTAPAVARAGAAVALGPVLGESEREQLRIAAAASASPKLRIALERAIEKDPSDDSLEEALSELEAEQGDAAHERGKPAQSSIVL